ncbi:MAG: methyltransferase domain-containing protein [Magnetococcales bacterium]|nr:methyltransferase domain-containing protein [Magnetococcales bacterium]
MNETRLRMCPICDSSDTMQFLLRRNVPVHENLALRDYGSSRSIARGAMELVACRLCGFIFNNAFDFHLLSYGQDYDSNQSYSHKFSGYLDDIVDYLQRERSVTNARVVEIGCGRGSFIRKLVGDTDTGNTGIGFDPSYEGPELDLGGRLSFQQSYYDTNSISGSMDVVICRHVIEHIPNPLELLRNIRHSAYLLPSSRVFFETPDVEWILRHNVLYDFTYEHCSLFSERSIVTAFQRCGFSVTSVHHVFDDQYLWIEAVPTNLGCAPSSLPPDSGFTAFALAYASKEKETLLEWIGRLQLVLSGSRTKKIGVWGAGGKGTVFLNLIDPDRQLIDCAVDINPNKQGCYVSGTGHPIVSYHDLFARQVTDVIVMNPIYYSEVQALITQNNIPVTLIDWSSVPNLSPSEQ